MADGRFWTSLIALAGLVAASPAFADPSVEQFYKGNQIKLFSSAGPGSGYTLWTRFICVHLGRHIPGEPTIIPQSMPGAGGLIAANYMYSVAPKDGREIA